MRLTPKCKRNSTSAIHQIWALFCNPMARERHLWYSNLALATLEKSEYFIIGYTMANSPYMPKLGSLCYSHGLDEALVIN